MQNTTLPGAAGRVIPIIMPQAGNTMEEGTVVMWLVQPGDMIEKGQVILEVETDKATLEVEAEYAGRLAKIVVEEGETVPVKTPLAYIADKDADVEEYIAAQSRETAEQKAPAQTTDAPSSPAAAAATTQQPGATEGGGIKASPAAKKLAREMGMDLAAVTGSGPGGRIVTSDVEKARAPSAGPVRHPMTAMRKAIARTLLASKQNIPHFYVRHTIDAGPMYDFYQTCKAEFKCSLNDVIVMACAKAIHEFPEFRSRLDGDEIVEFPTANIGIAVGVEDGLVVPVLVAAENMTLREIAEKTQQIVNSARNGKLHAVGQGVFTITNLGMFGVEEFSAIINPPEAAILAVGAVRNEVVVSGGGMHPGKVMTMTISCDHRIIDGLVAAKFMARLKEILETPEEMKIKS